MVAADKSQDVTHNQHVAEASGEHVGEHTGFKIISQKATATKSEGHG